MSLIVLLVTVVAAALVVGIVVWDRRQRVKDRRSEVCVLCLLPIRRTDHIAAMKENVVRELLGEVPTGIPPSTDPLGNLRWLGHADCAADTAIDLRTAGKVIGAPPPPSADPTELVCPVCGHHFRRPDIVIATEETARRYGGNAQQCPRCDHIWDAGGPPRSTIRG